MKLGRGVDEGRRGAGIPARALWVPCGLWFLIGCQLVGVARPDPEPAPVSEPVLAPPPAAEESVDLLEGDFRGTLMVEGESMQAHLFLTSTESRELTAILEGPVEFRAEGQGSVEGEEVRLELSYGGQCPGSLLLEGSWDPDQELLSGIVRASDCTGRGQGTFRFARFPVAFSHRRP